MIVTSFRNRLKPEHQAEYYSYAKEIRELAATMPRFIGQKSFVAEDGERVSIVEFASEETHQAWREHPGHRVAQALGRGTFYSEYRVQVCTLKRDYSYSISSGGES
jgi:heme-degrading monooxygenase HmoA